jgi:hypothetical protein
MSKRYKFEINEEIFSVKIEDKQVFVGREDYERALEERWIGKVVERESIGELNGYWVVFPEDGTPYWFYESEIRSAL